MKSYEPRPLPNFLIIGAQKSATRWLRDNLAQHPQISIHASEMEFFTHKFEHGIGWYRERLAIPSGVLAAGECTPGYMHWINQPHLVAARIDGSLPDVRVIALLRNPIDRTSSAYVHHARMGRLDGSRSLMDEIAERDADSDRLGLISGSWYGKSLEPYARRFGQRLLVVLHDDVRKDPVGLYRTVARHLDVTAGWVPESLTQVAHTNRADVSETVLKGAELTAQNRKDLWKEFFAEDTERLVDMVNVDVRHWDPTARRS